MSQASHSTIPDYDKALRLVDLEALPAGQLRQKILDLDFEYRKLQKSLTRTRDQLNQLSAGLTRMIAGGGA